MTTIKTPPQAILFDWDGTLVDTMGCVLAGHNAVRRHYDLPQWDMATYKATIAHRSSREIYPDLYGEKASEALEVLYGYINENHLNSFEVLPGAMALMETLFNTSIKLGIVSNKRHDILRREVAHLGWQDNFFSIIGAGYAQNDKPDPAPFNQALEEGGIKAPLSTIWYVGDAEPDMALAKNVGCHGILVNSSEKESLIEKYAPLGVFDSCHDLQKALIGCI